jgi:hypothetical protein
LKLNLIFFLKKKIVKKNFNIVFYQNNTYIYYNSFIFFKNFFKKFFLKKIFKKKFFLKFLKKNVRGFFFLNKFLQYFLENFFKKKIVLNLKKGSNKLILKQISNFYFFNKFFKKNLKISKQIIGILYYSILLKDSIIFSNFFKKKFESINIKLHKKLLLGLKKLIKNIFKPKFNYFGLKGIFINIKGKLGVSGNAKKRRYFLYFGKHSITKRTMKFSHKQTNI